MKVEIIARDTIKPASPTPEHLRNLQFSFLDQIATPVFMPMVFFYPIEYYDVNVGNFNRTERLKESLSETLTRFYPLAGRVKNNAFIDCNDEGVRFVQARVKSQLSDVVRRPEPDSLNKLLPYELDNVGDLILAIQVNIFDCDGMAIGVCMSHKFADALSLIMFLNNWAATARGNSDTDKVSPRFDLATLFPPRSISGFKPSTGIIKDKIVTRRFVFSASVIAALRAKYADNGGSGELQRRPTRIEALSAFIWSRFMATTQGKPDPEKLYTVLHAVNLRTRMDPPLPQYYFGNISRFAIALPSINSEEECFGIVSEVRDAIRKIDGDYVRKLQEGNGHLNFMKERAEKITKGEVVSFSFTSLCRFPLYETDFGWGKPIWVGSASLTFKNLVVFMDTSSSGGIEAWINMKKEDMAKFESDVELLAFVC
ncbi:vinorine synthase-like [Durio zibethinus]|uniref:Vinorine synthase-like n=1 Tax=Durio zibethinus TaxID=66656 RepID=A0A6P5Y2C7_DURZI|nr:vinorine synthase-like [Durio zibethinus]